METQIRYPAEWEQQRATWLALPINEQNWASRRDRIDRFYDSLIKTISDFQDAVTLDELKIPHDDIWIRDYGPFFVERNGNLAIVSYEFNAWGAKFPPWDKDNAVPKEIATRANLHYDDYKWILEGGAMEFNGDGLCMTTATCLHGRNRNSKESHKELLLNIKSSLGITDLKILPKGLDGDHTDGHIDNLARFLAKNHIVMAEGFLPEKESLEKWLAERYEGARVDVLPLPPQNKLGDEILPASYMNFIFVNGGLIVPIYNCDTDKIALDYFRKVYPERKVIGIDSQVALEEGGSLHCLTKQEPVVK